MARRVLRDDDGNEYEVDLPDDDGGSRGGETGSDDGDTIYLDEEDIEWLRKKRREEAEADRRRSSSGKQSTTQTGKIVRIRAKQSAGSSSQNPRRRVLKLG